VLFERELDAAMQIGRGEASPGVAQRFTYNMVHIVHECARAIELVFKTSGGRSLRDSNPLQRYMRDVLAMTLHGGLDLDRRSVEYGQGLLASTEFRLPGFD
jgi:alkylation response protein AidB-like acyl-CoA dehydrogenase